MATMVTENKAASYFKFRPGASCTVSQGGHNLCHKICEKYVKNNFFFQMGAILKFDFQKRKQLHTSKESNLNYTSKTQYDFAY